MKKAKKRPSKNLTRFLFILYLIVLTWVILFKMELDFSLLKNMNDRSINLIPFAESVTINGKTGKESAPHIISVSVEDVRSEVLLHSLEEKGIYVSAGSACSSNKPSVSQTLTAIGLRKELLDATVRFSFCRDTTREEVEYALAALAEIIPFRRKFTRK